MPRCVCTTGLFFSSRPGAHLGGQLHGDGAFGAVLERDLLLRGLGLSRVLLDDLVHHGRARVLVALGKHALEL